MENIKELINNLIARIEILEGKVNDLSKSTITPNINNETSKFIRDKTKYMYNGVVYSKNRLVLAIITDYVLQNPKKNYQNLSIIFDKSFQGSLGVVRLFSEIKNRKDAAKRFFTNDIIKLDSGEEVVVCTQWGAFNINRFITLASSLNFSITKLD
jgi:hypothetical protein